MPQSISPPFCGSWTRRQFAKWHHHNWRATYVTTLRLPPITHFISPCSPRWRPRPMRSHSSNPPLAFIFLRSSFFPSQEGVPTSALGVPFSPLFQPHCPGGDWAAPRLHPRPLFSLWQLGVRRQGSLFMHGVQPVVPPLLCWNPFHSKLPASGPMELPHMFHPGPIYSTYQRGGVLRHGADTFDPLQLQWYCQAELPHYITHLSSQDQP